jgi:hypothetical protein
VQLTPGERRLEHVAGVNRALRRPGTHQGVHLVNEDHVTALGLGELLDHRLQPLLELPPVLGAGQHLADIEGHDVLVPEGLRDVAVDDPLGQSFDDGGLADPGLPDQDGVVLGPAGEDLHDPTDLLVPPDDWIELSRPGRVGQVPGVPLERLVLALGLLIGHPVRSPDLLQGGPELSGPDVLG